jgi:hypothetical protein
LFGGKVECILRTKTGQDAVIEIDTLLAPIFCKNPESLSQPEKNICYIEDLEREVNNGGFGQFFLNSSGDNTRETISALKEIGSKRFLSLLELAVQQFPGGKVPTDRDERLEVMEQMEARVESAWDDLTDQFYRYDEDIYGLLIAYIQKNVTDFR